LQVLNRVDLEDYVTSTVGGEMSPSWPQEALRAQAVAARTYVLHEAGKRRSSAWDVRATIASQVYRGIVTETDETRSATRATRGEVLTYGGEPILAVFHSTAGGRTATAGEVWGEDLPYLRVVDVEEEDGAPHTYWRTQFTSTDLRDVLNTAGIKIGALEGFSVTRRTPSGRVERLEVRAPGELRELRGASLRSLVSALGLRSTLFDIRATADGFAFVGSGYGHGVGMSQWGARGLAERGMSYQRILARFYPGTRLERRSSRRAAFVPRNVPQDIRQERPPKRRQDQPQEGKQENQPLTSLASVSADDHAGESR
jgi:stage II sporulation protein D